ncbi:Zinc finger, C2H2 [Phytophthora cinnamomi]|uniref:Zinc finger, C2H2 n=1 Tax=Phytophthora cinnamomi TaxID=4785 RepID=UPI0035597361|nr:Zinc finger, C2H2 [Phytophthora cinnamomi]
MQRFCWRERSEKLNWRLLGALDVGDVVRRGDPAALEPYALHVTFARLPTAPRDPATRDAWFLVRVLQLAMEYLLFMRARDGDVLEALGQELRHAETERDGLLLRAHKWKARARSGDKQVDKLHQVLQNIAKLLQIHGASPSAVATIETLLTELISERRAKMKRRAVMEKENEDGNDMEGVLRPAVQEARVCGFCGKLFSSKEYLEKHLVRRHAEESIEVETPVKPKMRWNFGDASEGDADRARKEEDQAASETVMQNMVHQVERALREHEEKLRLLAEEEAQKVKEMYERLRTETKLAEELKATRIVAEYQNEDSRRQLDEICLQRQKAEDELADLKQQIQFHTLKTKMMGSAGLPATNVLHRDDDKLAAAEAEIKNLQQTLEDVNTELTAAREELTKVQALHLSALRKKKELADKLASTREASAVIKQEMGSQTEGLPMVNEFVQTDEKITPPLIESETETITEASPPICEDVGTDPVTWSYEDAASQTIDILRESPVDAEVQVANIDDSLLTLAPAISLVEPDPSLRTLSTVDTGVGTDAEDDTLSKPPDQEDERIPDYIQQLHSQDLLDALAVRAQKAASNVVSSDPALKNYSSISRHKYVRSRFQHDENAVKERVASALAQLEQFSHRFGVPAKSAWLSEENLQIVQQALHGHLEVLPNEVLARMIECENSVNGIIEKEWVPMEKTRQQALDRFKMEAHAKSEISQGLVRQAMATFGASVKSAQMTSNGVNTTIKPDRPSIVTSSEMSFGMDIPSLGDSGESVEESTSAVVMGLIDALDKQNEAEIVEGSGTPPDRTPATRDAAQSDSVMSFDDSDIEEVVLT